MVHLKNIVILGAGALGGVYASMLSEARETNVSMIADGERYERLTRQGFIINGRQYMFPVRTPEDERPPADLILVALKHQHLAGAVHDIKRCVGERTSILSVMNGLESEEYFASLYGKEKVLYGISVGIDAVREGNNITFSHVGKIIFGEAENSRPSQRVQQVQALFDRAGIEHETPQDMIRALWWKFMVNVGINQASAILRAPYGIFQQSKDAQALMESAMREVIVIARAANVNLVEDDLRHWYTVLHTLSPQGKTSMLQDVEAHRKTEVEMFAGKVVELGHIYHIDTPVNLTFLRMIKAMEASFSL